MRDTRYEQRDTRCDSGFTLVEMIVVMAIISILAGLLLAGVSAARARGGITKTKALITELSLLVSQYESNTGDYPQGAGGAESAEALCEALTSAKGGVQHEFAPDALRDTDGDGRPEIVDYWQRPFSYYHHRSYAGPPRETTYRLVSAGPDGEEGTDDDVRNY
jgi:general secretion pathway protein G